MPYGDAMKKEYDFSKGERGKFYRAGARLNLPIYLDEDIADFVKRYAEDKEMDVQTVVNTIIRTNKEMIQALR
jgi:hypothetical protein